MRRLAIGSIIATTFTIIISGMVPPRTGQRPPPIGRVLYILTLSILLGSGWVMRANASSSSVCSQTPTNDQVLASLAAAPPKPPSDSIGRFWVQLDGDNYIRTSPRLPSGTYPSDGATPFTNVPDRGTIVTAFSTQYSPINGS